MKGTQSKLPWFRMRVRLRLLNRVFSLRRSGFCLIAMQEAVDWIRGTSERHDQVMDHYVAGDADICLCFLNNDLNVDLIAYFMRGNSQVISLSLSDCNFTEEDLLSLLNALQANTFVLSLSLCGMELVGQNMAAVANFVKHNGSIGSLYLLDCKIDGNGIALLCEALSHKNSLIDMNLSGNSIGSRGAEALGQYLKTDPPLSSLHLSKSLKPGDNVTALAAGLKINTNLEFLCLHDCTLGDREAVVFADVLRHNTGLKELDLIENEIGVSGLVELARALRVNRSLQKLWFGPHSGKELEKNAEDAFVDMLGMNICITGLRLDPDLQGEEVVGNLSFKPLLRRNRDLLPAAVRRAALLLIGVCRPSTNYEGMGVFAIVPKDVVKLIAKEVWATRSDPIWIQAL